MRGGAQSHLLRCTYRDPQGGTEQEGFFVTKFQNNPQHVRILANELLCFRLARHLQLPVPEAEQVEVSGELLEKTPDLHMEMPQGSVGCTPGIHFGSRYPGDPRRVAVFEFVPDSTLDRLENLQQFRGMLLFDQWTCNVDARQAIFVRAPSAGKYQALMVDQGFCFNDGMWNFPDSPLHGLYHRRRVYAGVTGWDSFEPWFTWLREMPMDTLDRIYREVPTEWYGGEQDALECLLEKLSKRRKLVPELITAVRKSSANPFPKWRVQ